MVESIFEVKTCSGGRGCFAKARIPTGHLILEGIPVMSAPFFCLDRRYPIRCRLCWKTIPRTLLCQGCHMEAICFECGPSDHAVSCTYLQQLHLQIKDKSDISADIITLAHMVIQYLVSLSFIPDTEAALAAIMDLCYLNTEALDATLQQNLSQCITLITTSLVDFTLPSRIPYTITELSTLILLRELCNGFCFWDEEYEKYGTALLPCASYFNHSCLPNAYKVSSHGRIYIYALHPIEEEEEITFSYVPHNYETEQRQDILSTYFGFDCNCPRCGCSSSDRTDAVEAFETDVIHDCGGVWGCRSVQTKRLVCSICQQKDDNQN